MLMRLMSKGEYLIVPKGTKFMGSGKLGLSTFQKLIGYFFFEQEGPSALYPTDFVRASAGKCPNVMKWGEPEGLLITKMSVSQNGKNALQAFCLEICDAIWENPATCRTGQFCRNKQNNLKVFMFFFIFLLTLIIRNFGCSYQRDKI